MLSSQGRHLQQPRQIRVDVAGRGRGRSLRNQSSYEREKGKSLRNRHLSGRRKEVSLGNHAVHRHQNGENVNQHSINGCEEERLFATTAYTNASRREFQKPRPKLGGKHMTVTGITLYMSGQREAVRKHALCGRENAVSG